MYLYLYLTVCQMAALLPPSWYAVTSGRAVLPGRWGHTVTSLTDDVLYVFGGLRAGMMYGDLWRYQICAPRARRCCCAARARYG
jgi:hypothetical protein